MPPEWGAVYDGRTLSLSILVPSGSAPMVLDRGRFGRTVLDLRVRTGPGRVTVQVRLRFGPPLPMQVELRGLAEEQHLLVDGYAVGGRIAGFVASGEHEIQFLGNGS